MTDCYSPPAQGTWYDADVVTSEVLAKLQLRDTDVHQPLVLRLVPVAAELINNRLDRVYEMTPYGTMSEVDPDDPDDVAELLESNVTLSILESLRDVTIELYMRRGIPGRTDIVVDSSVDPIDVAAPTLEEGAKSRWGFA